MQSLPTALAALGSFRQFMLYRLVPSQTRPGKMDKFPVSPVTMDVVNAHDSAHWTDHATACNLATATGLGVAFVFTAADPFFFLDIDGARDASGQWSGLAQELAAALPGAAMELSQSGTGMHIFGMVSRPLAHACKNVPLNLELYTEMRFAALTGLHAMGDVRSDQTEALEAIIEKYFPFKGSANGDFGLSAEPVPEWRGPVDDEELLRRALASKSAASAFGAKASFADLWEANVDVLARVFPDKDRPYDQSQADAALAAHLAFWTGRHGERMQALMLRSGLVREKYDRDDYLPRTISEILARPGQVCQDAPLMVPAHLRPIEEQRAVAQEAALAPAGPAVPPLGPQIIVDGAEKKERPPGGFINSVAWHGVFGDCVFVVTENRALVPKMGLVKREVFNVIYGGFTYCMDDINERTTRTAWEAFTEHQVHRPATAKAVTFRPDLAYGELVDENGVTLVNTYMPAQIRSIPGDASPFLTHLAKVLPDTRDQYVFMSYMAACVQYKGVKFQWAPLIQGVEGNGKTLFTRCVAQAVGLQYVHMPRADEIGEKFNSWLFNNILIGVEDIYVSDNKAELLEILKPMITAEILAKRAMQTDQYMQNVVCNFMFNSNHKDAVRKARNDRRLCIFYSAQQDVEDLERDGMTGDYFPNLYRWLKADGYAIVADYLQRFPIPWEFNPAIGCIRAPETSSTHEVLQASRGGVEQHVMEAIASESIGFRGGWVSAHMLGALLDGLKRGGGMTLNKRRTMMQGLGYDYHPALPDGRAPTVAMPDGKKTQLYVRNDSPSRLISDPAAVVSAYTAAQK